MYLKPPLLGGLFGNVNVFRTLPSPGFSTADKLGELSAEQATVQALSSLLQIVNDAEVAAVSAARRAGMIVQSVKGALGVVHMQQKPTRDKLRALEAGDGKSPSANTIRKMKSEYLAQGGGKRRCISLKRKETRTVQKLEGEVATLKKQKHAALNKHAQMKHRNKKRASALRVTKRQLYLGQLSTKAAMQRMRLQGQIAREGGDKAPCWLKNSFICGPHVGHDQYREANQCRCGEQKEAQENPEEEEARACGP